MVRKLCTALFTFFLKRKNYVLLEPEIARLIGELCVDSFHLQSIVQKDVLKLLFDLHYSCALVKHMNLICDEVLHLPFFYYLVVSMVLSLCACLIILPKNALDCETLNTSRV